MPPHSKMHLRITGSPPKQTSPDSALVNTHHCKPAGPTPPAALMWVQHPYLVPPCIRGPGVTTSWSQTHSPGSCTHFPCQHQMAQQEGRGVDELMALGDHLCPTPYPRTRQPWLCLGKSHHGAQTSHPALKSQHRAAGTSPSHSGYSHLPGSQRMCHPHLLPLRSPLLLSPAVCDAGAAPRRDGAATGQARAAPARSISTAGCLRAQPEPCSPRSPPGLNSSIINLSASVLPTGPPQHRLLTSL